MEWKSFYLHLNLKQIKCAVQLILITSLTIKMMISIKTLVKKCYD